MPEDDIDLQISTGSIRGLVREGIATFLGLPFATPPVGPLRFRSPQPVTPWSQVREAKTAVPSAPQILSGGSAWIYEDDGNPNEDCLNLNLWTPGLNGQRPVMVWFHGGAFRTGHAALSTFDGTRLALDGNVVVVTCNYRLGGLGWLAHPDLADPETGAWANWGLQDQVAALHWVQDNIAEFGGDPGNITLFGESAGAMSIAHIARNPANTGLFHKLIAQSPARRHRYAADPELSQAYADSVASTLGVSIAKLREVDAETLQEAERATGRDSKWASLNSLITPVADGVVVADERKAAPITVPLLAGTNRHEAAMWFSLVHPDGTRAASGPPLEPDQLPPTLGRLLANDPTAASFDPASVLAAYQAAAPDSAPVENFKDAYTDFIFRAPVAAWAQAQTYQGHAAYVYEFAHPSPIPGLGSPHTLEIPFVFGTFADQFMAPKTGAGRVEATLSELMRTIWTTFARTGDPAITETGDWQPYDSAQRSVLVLGGSKGPASIASAPREATRALWDPVLAVDPQPSSK